LSDFAPTRLLTESLLDLRQGEAAARIMAAALDAVDPGPAVSRHLARHGEGLVIGGESLSLDAAQRVLVVGAGKAGLPMAEAAVEALGDRSEGGLVIVKEGYAGGRSRVSSVEVVEAGHPLPDRRGVDGTRRLVDLLARMGGADLVVCLISGGGSALLTLPVEGVSLEDLRTLTDALLASGATINEINALRKHLDQVKGGELARIAAPARVRTLILSDVVGSPLDVIASGPTVPDTSTYADAWAVLERYDIVDRTPEPIRLHLRRGVAGEWADTPKPGDPLFERVRNILVGSNPQAAEAALDRAVEEGFHALLLTTYLQGEAREAGRTLAAVARQMAEDGRPVPRPGCLVVGGETTVTLRGEGVGGRNQELALGAARDLAGLPEVALVALATDGGDGPTSAAGAVVTGDTLARAEALGLDPDDYLSRNDAFHFFEPLGDLLMTGPTQTNVNDLAFLFAF
jgi:hydroxypyruvate reductase